MINSISVKTINTVTVDYKTREKYAEEHSLENLPAYIKISYNYAENQKGDELFPESALEECMEIVVAENSINLIDRTEIETFLSLLATLLQKTDNNDKSILALYELVYRTK